jgi:hypothetical protein
VVLFGMYAWAIEPASEPDPDAEHVGAGAH